VFQVDTTALLAGASVYDSLGTLRRSCPWASSGSLDLIVKVMHALDSERNDVRASGAFLGKCHEESRRRVESFGGGSTFGPPIDWKVLLTADVLEKLLSRGVTTADLDLIDEEFEAFWNVALGKMAGIETIHTDTGLTESQDLSRAYFVAFDQVRLKLKEAWTLNLFSKHNHPGWDLSPFGYVAKTIRDGEFFSSGDVPGDCIREAVIVDWTGSRKEVLTNNTRSSSPG
jgi:hypothetical protein